MTSTTAKFEYVSLSVRDLDEALAFYGSVFGLDQIRSRLDLPEHGLRSVIVASASGWSVEFFERKDAITRAVTDAIGASATAGWVHLALRVDDLPGVVDQVVTVGGSLVSAPAA